MSIERSLESERLSTSLDRARVVLLVGLGSQSLAGRVEILELGGFGPADVGAERLDHLWQHRGGRGLLGCRRSECRCMDRQLDHLVSRHRAPAAWFAGPDVDAKSARRSLDPLTDALVVRQLLPWFVNTRKRQVAAPKIYLRDSGVFHRLQSIADREDLLAHPKVARVGRG